MDNHRNVYASMDLSTICQMVMEIKSQKCSCSLAVETNGYWKLSIGYFMIDGLTDKKRENLLEKAIELLIECI